MNETTLCLRVHDSASNSGEKKRVMFEKRMFRNKFFLRCLAFVTQFVLVLVKARLCSLSRVSTCHKPSAPKPVLRPTEWSSPRSRPALSYDMKSESKITSPCPADTPFNKKSVKTEVLSGEEKFAPDPPENQSARIISCRLYRVVLCSENDPS